MGWSGTWMPPRTRSTSSGSGYGATYVALAEMTAATALLTTDARLARAPGIECSVELL